MSEPQPRVTVSPAVVEAFSHGWSPELRIRFERQGKAWRLKVRLAGPGDSDPHKRRRKAYRKPAEGGPTIEEGKRGN